MNAVKQYVSVMRRWLWLILLCAVVGMLLARQFSSRLVPSYKATSGVVLLKTVFQLVLEPRFQTLANSELGQVRDEAATLAELVRNLAVAQLVFDGARDQLPPQIRKADDLLGLVSGEAKGNIVSITAATGDPEFSARLANLWAQDYSHYVNRVYGGLPAPADLDNQIAVAHDRYLAAQTELESFLRKSGQEDINRQIAEKQALAASLQNGRLAIVDQELAASAAQLTEAYSRLEKSERHLADAKALKASLDGAASAQASVMANALALLVLKTSVLTQSVDQSGTVSRQFQLTVDPAALSSLSGDPAQLARDADAVIAQLEQQRQQYDQEVRGLSSGLLRKQAFDYPLLKPLAAKLRERYPDLMAALPPEASDASSSGKVTDFDRVASTAIDELQTEVADLQAQLSGLQERQKEITQARDSAWESYQLLTKKGEEVRIASASAEGSLVRPAIIATPPSGPSNINYPLFSLLGAAVGALIALVLAFYFAFTDTKLRRPEDIEHELQQPTLGVIPAAPVRAGHRPVAAAKPTASLSEAVHTLYTSLHLLDGAYHSLLVTSPGVGEGKTSMAANLAVVAAQTGNQVILVDANLRKPQLHEWFQVPNSAGLSSLLQGDTASWQKLLQPAGVRGLRLMPGGPATDQAVEWLSSPQLRNLLLDMKQAADLVIIDSPAVGAVTDPVLLTNLVDGTLLVVAAGKRTPEEVQAATDLLQAAGGRVVGVVLNRVHGLGMSFGAYGVGGVALPFGINLHLPNAVAKGVDRLVTFFQ